MSTRKLTMYFLYYWNPN